MREIKVLLAGGKEIFREGLMRLLKEQPQINVVSQCSSSRQAVSKIKEIKPDVIIIDTNPLPADALVATQKISRLYPKVKIAVLTEAGNEDELFSVVQQGARGYLSKDISVDALVKCIELIAQGEIVISPLISSQSFKELISQGKARKGVDTRLRLSDRELEIVGLVVNGFTNKEIAQKLSITDNTSKVHIKNILSKLKLKNRQHLAAYAVQHGLVAAGTSNEESIY